MDLRIVRDWQNTCQQCALKHAEIAEGEMWLTHAKRYGALADEIERLQAENKMLRKLNTDLGIEAETAEALLKRWVAYHDTVTRSEPMKCIAEDSKRWIKAANAGIERR